MTAGACQGIGDGLLAQAAGVALVRTVDDEGDGAHRPVGGPHIGPVRHIGGRQDLTRPDGAERVVALMVRRR